jgi:hypothetical protein
MPIFRSLTSLSAPPALNIWSSFGCAGVSTSTMAMPFAPSET